MSEVVFILGAGASREAGAPLMADFLAKAKDLFDAGRCGEYAADFETVLNAVAELQQVYAKSKLDLDHFESVFGAFEMANLIEHFPGMKPHEIPNLVNSMKRLITKTLEESVELTNGSEGPDLGEAYKAFARLIAKLNHRKLRASILTFNYDVVFDFALHRAGVPITYSLGDQDNEGTTRLLKLHGSLNWTKCGQKECGTILPWHIDEFLKSRRRASPGNAVNKLNIGTSLRYSQLMHCGNPIVNHEPVIVPPTWNKTEYQHGLAKVWRLAAKQLHTAENIIVIGYSYPESDSFFKYLYALGSVSKVRLKRFAVFDTNGTVFERYRSLMGLDMEPRKYETHQQPFSKSIEVLDGMFFGKSDAAGNIF